MCCIILYWYEIGICEFGCTFVVNICTQFEIIEHILSISCIQIELKAFYLFLQNIIWDLTYFQKICVSLSTRAVMKKIKWRNTHFFSFGSLVNKFLIPCSWVHPITQYEELHMSLVIVLINHWCFPQTVLWSSQRLLATRSIEWRHMMWCNIGRVLCTVFSTIPWAGPLSLIKFYSIDNK